MKCDATMDLATLHWECDLPSGHYGPHASLAHGVEIQWSNLNSPIMKAPMFTETPKGDSLYVHVPDATRVGIMEALASMDDEAFSWLVLAMPPSAMLHGGTCQIWPDGLGGFRDREKIEALREAAQTWLNDLNRPK